MECIKIKKVIDINNKLNEWNEELKSLGVPSDREWELKYYPIRNDFLILVFECVNDCDEDDEIYNYRFLLYDFKQNKLLDKVFTVGLHNKMCCTVLEVNKDSLLLDVWDYVEDVNLICKVNKFNVIFESGYGVSHSTPIYNTDKIAVGYGYEAVNENKVAPMKIYDKKSGEPLCEYKNPIALGCVDIYADKEGAVWASFLGVNRIVMIKDDEVVEYECEMSGFDGIVMIDSNKSIYVNYDFDSYNDRIFKMEFDGDKYTNANEVGVRLINDQDEEVEAKVEGISSENGYVVCRVRKNVIGIMEI